MERRKKNSVLVLRADQLGALVTNTLPDWRGTNSTVIELTCFVTVLNIVII